MEQITIDGVTYNVIKSRTADQAEAEGLPRMAASMRQRGHRRNVYLQRPRGQKIYWSIQYKNFLM